MQWLGMTMMKKYTKTHQDAGSRARTGIIHTAHGDIETPVFMPVGTQATVKSLDATDMEALGAEVILANTYHLHLRPGEDTIRELGGVHAFQGWKRAVLTDSGGFQVFSLAGGEGEQDVKASPTSHGDVKASPTSCSGKLVKIDEDGVTFRSHLDGSSHRFTPEEAIRIQQKLGADIIMAFDQCTKDDAPEKEAREAMERTHRWAERCVKAFEDKSVAPEHAQQLFGIVQGGSNKELRRESAKYIASLPFDGFAIGGESVGYNMERTKEILDWLEDLLPEDKARYTMGVGLSPEDLFDVVEKGIDMFDCVSPTRLARNGSLFNHAAGREKKFRIEISNKQFEKDDGPIDKTCACSTCKKYTRAYLKHLFAAKELVYFRLATIHNLHFLLDLLRQVRSAIKEDRFLEFKNIWLKD